MSKIDVVIVHNHFGGFPLLEVQITDVRTWKVLEQSSRNQLPIPSSLCTTTGRNL